MLTRLSFTFWVAYGDRKPPKLLTKTFGRIESPRGRPIRGRSWLKTGSKMRSEKKQRALSKSSQICQTNEKTGEKTKKAGRGRSRLTLLTGVAGYSRFLLSAPRKQPIYVKFSVLESVETQGNLLMVDLACSRRFRIGDRKQPFTENRIKNIGRLATLVGSLSTSGGLMRSGVGSGTTRMTPSTTIGESCMVFEPGDVF